MFFVRFQKFHNATWNKDVYSSYRVWSILALATFKFVQHSLALSPSAGQQLLIYPSPQLPLTTLPPLSCGMQKGRRVFVVRYFLIKMFSQCFSSATREVPWLLRLIFWCFWKVLKSRPSRGDALEGSIDSGE